jgi:hypothetical protein
MTKKCSQGENKALRIKVRDLRMKAFRLNYAGGSYLQSWIIACRAATPQGPLIFGAASQEHGNRIRHEELWGFQNPVHSFHFIALQLITNSLPIQSW